MKPYEKILSKITPTFYKLKQYYEYFDNIDYPIITSYLSKAKLPKIYDVEFPLDWLDRKYFSMQAIENTKYYYYTGAYPFEIKGKTLYMKRVTMNIKYKLNVKRSFVYLSEFIVNMIINNFSFENENIHDPSESSSYAKNYKDLFVGLVGRDMYETIRQNIK